MELEKSFLKKMPVIYVALLVTLINICDVVIFKTVSIFGFTISMSGFLFPISFLLLSTLNETYGHKETERAIFMIILAQSLFIVTISIAIRMPSTVGLHTANLYFLLYHNLWRLLITANLAIVLSFYITSFLNSKIKIWLLGKHPIIRILCINSLAKAVLVLIAYPANFYDVLTFTQMLEMCFYTWIFKIVASLFLAWFVPLLIKLNKTTDKIDIYDFETSFNPINMFKVEQSGENMYGKKINESSSYLRYTHDRSKNRKFPRSEPLS